MPTTGGTGVNSGGRAVNRTSRWCSVSTGWRRWPGSGSTASTCWTATTCSSRTSATSAGGCGPARMNCSSASARSTPRWPSAGRGRAGACPCSRTSSCGGFARPCWAARPAGRHRGPPWARGRTCGWSGAVRCGLRTFASMRSWRERPASSIAVSTSSPARRRCRPWNCAWSAMGASMCSGSPPRRPVHSKDSCVWPMRNCGGPTPMASPRCTRCACTPSTNRASRWRSRVASWAFATSRWTLPVAAFASR